MAEAQEKHSKPGPLKLVTPPNPCQRPIGTSASNSISSEVWANSRVFGQLICNTPSIVEIAQPRSRLVPKVPSLSLRLLKTGLVVRHASCVVTASMTCPPEATVRPPSLRMANRCGNRRRAVRSYPSQELGTPRRFFSHVDLCCKLP